MDIQNIVSAKSALIVTPDKLNLDLTASMITLAGKLEENNIKTTVLTHIKHYAENFEQDIPKGTTDLKRRIVSNTFSANIPANKEIQDIKINKEDNNYKIEVITKSGNIINPTLNLVRESEDFDVIILLGFTALDNSNEFKKTYGNLIKNTTTILVGYTDMNIDVDHKYIKPGGSVSETVASLLGDAKYSLNSEEATFLLAGVISNTQNLKINIEEKTIARVNTLVHTYEANYKKANKIANKGLTKEQFEWHKKVFQNLLRTEYLAYSIIDDLTITPSQLGGLSNENKIPFNNLKDIEISVVLTRLSKNTHVFVRVNSQKYSALSITESYPRVGDHKFVHFWSKSSPNKIIKNLKKDLGIIKAPVIKAVVDPSQVAPTKVTPTITEPKVVETPNQQVTVEQEEAVSYAPIAEKTVTPKNQEMVTTAPVASEAIKTPTQETSTKTVKPNNEQQPENSVPEQKEEKGIDTAQPDNKQPQFSDPLPQANF